VWTSADPDSMRDVVRGVIARTDPSVAVGNMMSMEAMQARHVSPYTMMAGMMSVLAIVTVTIATVGLYGLIAYSVAQRTREIGVRMALGADKSSVRVMVLRQVGVMTAIGGVIGMAGAYGLGRAASSLLYKLQGHDPAVFATAAVVLTLVALGAGLLPALRASRVDPMQALRYE